MTATTRNQIIRQMRSALHVAPPESWTLGEITAVNGVLNDIVRKRSDMGANVIPFKAVTR